jgi:hypothetical protein
MLIESDRAEALSGIRHGLTTGGPIALLIPNKDWTNWQRTMYSEPEMPAGASGADRSPVTRPRPGHADLAGFVKYGHEDMRNVLERASARETAARVAVGATAVGVPVEPTRGTSHARLTARRDKIQRRARIRGPHHCRFAVPLEAGGQAPCPHRQAERLQRARHALFFRGAHIYQWTPRFEHVPDSFRRAAFDSPVLRLQNT